MNNRDYTNFIEEALTKGSVFVGKNDYTRKFSSLILDQNGELKSEAHIADKNVQRFNHQNIDDAVHYVRMNEGSFIFATVYNEEKQPEITFVMMRWENGDTFACNGFYDQGMLDRLVYNYENGDGEQLKKDLQKAYGGIKPNTLVGRTVKKFFDIV